MKARIPMSAKMRKIVMEAANEYADQRQNEISTRAQWLWMMAMLQAGLSPKTIQRVADHMDAVTAKFAEYKTEGLGDEFAKMTLERAGVLDAAD